MFLPKLLPGERAAWTDNVKGLPLRFMQVRAVRPRDPKAVPTPGACPDKRVVVGHPVRIELTGPQGRSGGSGEGIAPGPVDLLVWRSQTWNLGHMLLLQVSDAGPHGTHGQLIGPPCEVQVLVGRYRRAICALSSARKDSPKSTRMVSAMSG